jgi:hypothetical protein
MRSVRDALMKPADDERRLGRSRVLVDLQRRIRDWHRRPDGAFESSFADYIGELSEDAKSLFLAVVKRFAADPDQLSAGGGIGSVD